MVSNSPSPAHTRPQVLNDLASLLPSQLAGDRNHGQGNTGAYNEGTGNSGYKNIGAGNVGDLNKGDVSSRKK